jgi:hypothetical protein
MQYLHFQPHRLASSRLESLIGTFPLTPLDHPMAKARSGPAGCGWRKRSAPPDGALRA